MRLPTASEFVVWPTLIKVIPNDTRLSDVPHGERRAMRLSDLNVDIPRSLKSSGPRENVI